MYVLLLVMLVLVHSGSRASKCPWPWHVYSIWAAGFCTCPWPWQVCSIWTAGGGSVRVRPCSGSRLDGVARRAPPRGRRIRVGVTCKMFWRMLHMLRLCVQVVGCLMHELLYMTLFMPTRFRFKLFQTCVSQIRFPYIPIPVTFVGESGYWVPLKLNISLADLFH